MKNPKNNRPTLVLREYIHESRLSANCLFSTISGAIPFVIVLIAKTVNGKMEAGIPPRGSTNRHRVAHNGKK